MQERLLGALNPTEEQIAKLEPIIESYSEKLMVINKDVGTEMREKKKPILQAMQGEMKEHLSTEQQETLVRYIERIEKNRFGRRRGVNHENGNSSQGQKVKEGS